MERKGNLCVLCCVKSSIVPLLGYWIYKDCFAIWKLTPLQHIAWREGWSGITLKVSMMSQPSACPCRFYRLDGSGFLIAAGTTAVRRWRTSPSWLQLMGKDGVDIEDLKNRGSGPVIQLPLNQVGPVAWLSHGRGVLMSLIGFSSWRSNKPHSLLDADTPRQGRRTVFQWKAQSNIKQNCALWVVCLN